MAVRARILAPLVRRHVAVALTERAMLLALARGARLWACFAEPADV